jgi:hypothetical protein
MAGIKGYKPSAINKRNHEERMGWVPRKDLPVRHTGSGMSEAEVVSAELLGKVLLEWEERWYRERDHRESTKPYDERLPITGPRKYLENEAGVNGRAIYEIVRGRRKYVTLTVAEKLLMAIDREYMLVNGDIPVVPNPQWSAERYNTYMRERGCY